MQRPALLPVTPGEGVDAAEGKANWIEGAAACAAAAADAGVTLALENVGRGYGERFRLIAADCRSNRRQRKRDS